jgi:hypothetical protein
MSQGSSQLIHENHPKVAAKFVTRTDRNNVWAYIFIKYNPRRFRPFSRTQCEVCHVNCLLVSPECLIAGALQETQRQLIKSLLSFMESLKHGIKIIISNSLNI